MAWIIVFIVIAAIVGLVFGNQKGAYKKKGERGPIKGKRILTMNEQPTFLKLREALPEHFVLAQVAFSAFMTGNGYATRSLFNRKVADFVVVDKSFNVIAIVELDDSSHKGKENQDAARDALITEAGYKVIRYKRTPGLEQVKKDFGITTIKIPTILSTTTQAQEVELPIIETTPLPKTNLVSDAFIVEIETNEQKTS
jgi:very-short-patch-repair endonuclease